VLVGYYVAIPKSAPDRPIPAARLDLGGYVPARAQEPQTSNNRAEIGGILLALEALRLVGEGGWAAREATIWSDSRYAVMCANGLWKRNKNNDLWSAHDALLPQVTRVLPKKGYSLRWVKGHAGNEYNEAADGLATFAAFNFDEVRYASFRTVQRATGKEMLGEGALRSAGVTLRKEPASYSAERTGWIGGADYALGLQLQFKGRDASAGTGSGVGTYRIWDSEGRSRSGEVKHPGERLPDELEYMTLIAALEELKDDAEGKALLLYTGRELVAKQLRGEYRVKAASLIEPYRHASELLRGFRRVDIEWKRGKDLDEIMRDGPI
jgi:ribonuclease HI